MPYVNDVFISYKRGRINEQWVEENFLPMFEELLDNALPHKPRIFVDKTALAPGVDFSNALFYNLIFSKCIVSIWSPPYFRRSEWCVKEFLTTKFKQDVLFQLNEQTQPTALIWPVIFRKLTAIPPIANRMSYLDYSDFAIVGDDFFKSPLYTKLQQRMINDIPSIAEMIVNAPVLDPKWETPEGKSTLITQVNAFFGRHETDENLSQGLISWS
jgi:hypothetical protein